MIPNILSIAGSDPSGGAGIQADLKTISACGGYGMAVITALTAQNTQGVQGVQVIDSAFVAQQIISIFDDIEVDAVKIGMLANAEIVAVVATLLRERFDGPIILDPVMVATSGDRLLDEGSVSALKDLLIPQASLITPNIPEGEVLLRKSILEAEVGVQSLYDAFGVPVLLKGGHLKGDTATDYLLGENGLTALEAQRIDTLNTHGTGCTLSSAVASFMGHGMPLQDAVSKSKNYVTSAIAASDMLQVGRGHGPLHHAYKGGRH